MAEQKQSERNAYPEQVSPYPVTTNHPTYHDDEISLVDLGLIIVRHRVWLYSVFLLCTLGTALFALLRPEAYEYATVVEVGSYIPDGESERTLIEPMAVVESKLKERFIAQALLEHSQANPDDRRAYTISVSSPKDSNLFVLKSKGDAEDAIYLQLQQSAAQKLLADHQRLMQSHVSALQLRKQQLADELAFLQNTQAINAQKVELENRLAEAELQLSRLEAKIQHNAQRAKLENELAKARIALEKIQDETRIGYRLQELEANVQAAQNRYDNLRARQASIARQLVQLDKKERLLTQQLQSSQEDLKKLQQQRDTYASKRNGTDAMQVVLLIDNRIQQSNTHIQRLEERVYFGLEQDRARLEQEQQNASRELTEVQAALVKARNAIDQFKSDNAYAIQQQRNVVDSISKQLNKLDEDYAIALQQQKNEVANLKKALASFEAGYEKRLKDKQREMQSVDNKLAELVETGIAVEAHRSAQAVGTASSLIIALGLIVGGLLGLIACFVAEFMARVREKEGVVA